MKYIAAIFVLFGLLSLSNPVEDEQMIRKIYDAALVKGKSYDNLRELCKDVGHRLTGSKGDTAAVRWAVAKMNSMGYKNVRMQPFEANLWKRGTVAKGKIITDKKTEDVSVIALGSSVGTGEGGITAEVVEVNGWDELQDATPDRFKGKIIFYNRAMSPVNINTFVSYGQTVDQRGKGASEAARVGAVAALVRSVTLSGDEHPHTGNMHYADDVTKVPGFAISAKDADKLHVHLLKSTGVKVSLSSNCSNGGKVISNNVIGEIRGSVYPDKIIVVGAHLDSWDVGEGAHDDGAGVAHALEVLNIFNAIGYQPKHTIRCVLYMNEENGVGGGREYARVAKEQNEVHIAAIESDAGGFSPRGFHTDGMEARAGIGYRKLMSWKKLFEPYDLHYFAQNYAGTDIGPLMDGGTILFGLMPDSQRYFDFHHAETDVFEAVNKRELELGSASIAALIYLIDKDGLVQD